ncbi:MAG: class I SAM-dependent methyltransferase [Anaerolineaceae bacterium]
MTDQGSEGLFSPFLRQQRMDHAKPFLIGEVLEIGCGIGKLCALIPSSRYVGVDSDPEVISEAKSMNPGYQFQTFLPDIENKFDTILMLAVIEHIQKPEEFILQLTERLRHSDNSSIVITTPAPFAGYIHTTGAFLGFFSKHASGEHQPLLSRNDLERISAKCNLYVSFYKRFLLGMNQIAVFKLR